MDKNGLIFYNTGTRRRRETRAVDDISLSKEMSFALRHHPEAYGLVLDAQGWVSLEQLAAALRAKDCWRGLGAQDIRRVAERSDKKRFDVSGGAIRAAYGHSTPVRIERDPQIPPDVLYHGTARRYISAIMKSGLLPRGRQYVHLSADTAMALHVGTRRDSQPVLLEIDAAKAWTDGIRFYPGNDRVWLADLVPCRYIRFGDAEPQ